jgi:predicted site-specific integrase-resolvase
MYVNEKQASKILGLHPNTLRAYTDNGTQKSNRTKAGHRRYNVASYLGQQSTTLCYCRVSSPKQRDDLERQVKFMREQYPGAEVVKDIVRYLNYKRRGLKAILERAMQGEQLQIVVAHRYRLARFG